MKTTMRCSAALIIVGIIAIAGIRIANVGADMFKSGGKLDVNIKHTHSGEVKVSGEVKAINSGEVKTRVVNPPAPPPPPVEDPPTRKSTFMERQGLNPDGSSIADNEADTDPQARGRQYADNPAYAQPQSSDRPVRVIFEKSKTDRIIDAVVGIGGPALGGVIARGNNDHYRNRGRHASYRRGGHHYDPNQFRR